MSTENRDVYEEFVFCNYFLFFFLDACILAWTKRFPNLFYRYCFQFCLIYLKIVLYGVILRVNLFSKTGFPKN